MTEETTKRIAHLWYEVMWSKPDPDIADEIVEIAALPDRVWIRYKARGTQLGSAWGFPSQLNSTEPPFCLSKMAKSLTAGERFRFTIS